MLNTNDIEQTNSMLNKIWMHTDMFTTIIQNEYQK